MTRHEIDATLEPKKNAHVLLRCGHCGAPLGEAWPPRAEGYTLLDTYARMTAEHDGYSAVDTTRQWSLVAPANPKISAAMGFDRDERPDGSVVYRIISPKTQRNDLGLVVLDERGQPVMRERSAKRRSRDMVPVGPLGSPDPPSFIYGHVPVLPAVVVCWKCDRESGGRLNRVPIPQVD